MNVSILSGASGPTKTGSFVYRSRTAIEQDDSWQERGTLGLRDAIPCARLEC